MATAPFKGNDPALLVAFRAGDPKAIACLHRLHYAKLVDHAMKILNDLPASEDIATETFMKLLKKTTHFDRLSDLRSFLFTATHNASIDEQRKRKRWIALHPEIVLPSPADEPTGYMVFVNDPVVMGKLEAAVTAMGHRSLQLFHCIIDEQLNYTAIAERLGLSIRTIQRDIKKMVEELASIVEDGTISNETGSF